VRLGIGIDNNCQSAFADRRRTTDMADSSVQRVADEIDRPDDVNPVATN